MRRMRVPKRLPDHASLARDGDAVFARECFEQRVVSNHDRGAVGLDRKVPIAQRMRDSNRGRNRFGPQDEHIIGIDARRHDEPAVGKQNVAVAQPFGALEADADFPGARREAQDPLCQIVGAQRYVFEHSAAEIVRVEIAEYAGADEDAQNSAYRCASGNDTAGSQVSSSSSARTS